MGALGAAEFCDASIDYAKNRSQFGGNDASSN